MGSDAFANSLLDLTKGTPA